MYSDPEYEELLLSSSQMNTSAPIASPHKTSINIASPAKKIQQVIEEEEGEIETTFFEFSNVFKNDVVEKFVNLKQQVSQKYQNVIKKLEMEKEAIIITNNESVDKLKESIAKRDLFLQKFKELTFKFADLVATQKNHKNDKISLQASFYNWKLYVQQRKQKQKVSVTARKVHLSNVVKKYFHSWRVWYFNTKVHGNNLLWETKLQSMISQLKNDYELQLHEMNMKLESALQRIKEEEASKVQLQQGLKRALMRGVCAMNNHFLEIIRNTNQNGDQFIDWNSVDEKQPQMEEEFISQEQLQQEETEEEYLQTQPIPQVVTKSPLNKATVSSQQEHFVPQIRSQVPVASTHPKISNMATIGHPQPVITNTIHGNMNPFHLVMQPFQFSGTAAEEIQKTNVRVVNNARQQQQQKSPQVTVKRHAKK